MLTEKSTPDELRYVNKLCIEAKQPKDISDRLFRAKLAGKDRVLYRIKIKQTNDTAIIIRDANNPIMSPIMTLKGREGEGYAYLTPDGDILILESHAIRRYFNRHEHIPEEECSHLDDIEPDYRRRVVNDMLFRLDTAVSVANDLGTSDVCHFDGGVFLISKEGKIGRFYTFIMNRQTFPDQRMRSLKSEQYEKEIEKNRKYDKETDKMRAAINTFNVLSGRI